MGNVAAETQPTGYRWTINGIDLGLASFPLPDSFGMKLAAVVNGVACYTNPNLPPGTAELRDKRGRIVAVVKGTGK